MNWKQNKLQMNGITGCVKFGKTECWYKINRMIQANHLEINCGSLKQNGVVLDKITGNN